MEKRITGWINSTESFGAVDGPGVRFIVFLQGCRMRCRYCHNPETWGIAQTGTKMLSAPYEAFPEEIWGRVRRYRSYWKNGGGITVSGGEPLLQTEFVTELFKLAKTGAAGASVHCALDTAGEPFDPGDNDFMQRFGALMEVTDLVILDIKHIDEEKHCALTGHTNANILEMAEYLSDLGKPLWIRHVLVPGISFSGEDRSDLYRLREFIDTLHTVERVEVLPYHRMGVPKWEKLGIPYTLAETPVPTREEVQHAESILCG